jgi:hypothetical protein
MWGRDVLDYGGGPSILWGQLYVELWGVARPSNGGKMYVEYNKVEPVRYMGARPFLSENRGSSVASLLFAPKLPQSKITMLRLSQDHVIWASATTI